MSPAFRTARLNDEIEPLQATIESKFQQLGMDPRPAP